MTDSNKIIPHKDLGEVLFYNTGDDNDSFSVRLADETVWLTQTQLIALFQRHQSVISRHVNNVFKEGELDRESNMQKMHIPNSDKPVAFYNLDVIISVGYRVKSPKGTQFRIWATKTLKEHLVKGYTYNQQRIAEKGIHEAQQVLALLANTLESHELVSDEGKSVLAIVNRYSKTWQLLLQYDENKLPSPTTNRQESTLLEIAAARQAIDALKTELIAKNEATDLFGFERSDGLEGILGAIYQTFDGHDLYPSREEKAANLLYFIIKDHPFSDGNKRIGSFLFILFLQRNEMLAGSNFDNKALVALTLLTAASDPSQKEILVRLIVNLLYERED